MVFFRNSTKRKFPLKTSRFAKKRRQCISFSIVGRFSRFHSADFQRQNYFHSIMQCGNLHINRSITRKRRRPLKSEKFDRPNKVLKFAPKEILLKLTCSSARCTFCWRVFFWLIWIVWRSASSRGSLQLCHLLSTSSFSSIHGIVFMWMCCRIDKWIKKIFFFVTFSPVNQWKYAIATLEILGCWTELNANIDENDVRKKM